jgi:hypothetical protein
MVRGQFFRLTRAMAIAQRDLEFSNHNSHMFTDDVEHFTEPMAEG